MEGDSLEAQVDALFKRSDAQLHAFFNRIIEGMKMEQGINNEQLALIEVRSFLGRTVLISDNVAYPQFPERPDWHETDTPEAS
jgi:hypothetical protein